MVTLLAGAVDIAASSTGGKLSAFKLTFITVGWFQSLVTWTSAQGYYMRWQLTVLHHDNWLPPGRENERIQKRMKEINQDENLNIRR